MPRRNFLPKIISLISQTIPPFRHRSASILISKCPPRNLDIWSTVISSLSFNPKSSIIALFPRSTRCPISAMTNPNERALIEATNRACSSANSLVLSMTFCSTFRFSSTSCFPSSRASSKILRSAFEKLSRSAFSVSLSSAIFSRRFLNSFSSKNLPICFPAKISIFASEEEISSIGLAEKNSIKPTAESFPIIGA